MKKTWLACNFSVSHTSHTDSQFSSLIHPPACLLFKQLRDWVNGVGKEGVDTLLHSFPPHLTSHSLWFYSVTPTTSLLLACRPSQNARRFIFKAGSSVSNTMLYREGKIMVLLLQWRRHNSARILITLLILWSFANLFPRRFWLLCFYLFSF